MSTASGDSMLVTDDRSEDTGASEQVRGAARGARGRGKGRKKIVNMTPSVKTRSQRLKDSNVGGSSMSTDTQHQSDSRRSLWKDDTSDISSSRSAFASIIDKYHLTFNGKTPPRIPLCRLEAFTRVRKLQLSSAQTEELKRSFRLNGYMESCHGFHVSPVDEDGEEVLVTAEDESSWDFFWKTASQDFDRECRADPDLAVLAGKKFKVWDGNHRVTVWMQVSAEQKYRNSLVHHPRVRCVIVSPPPTALKEMEVAMHNLNITSHATVQYDWIQDAERTFQVLSTPLIEYKPLLGEKVYLELEESRKKTSTKGWYSDSMTITAGAYIMSYSEVMAAQKELIHWEKEMEAKGEKITEQKKNDKWKKMLTSATRHWNALLQKYATIVNPQLGPEFLSTVRELHTNLSKQEKGKRDVKVEVGVERIKSFAAAPVPPELKVQLLKVHYSGDIALRGRYHHPPGNDLDDIRSEANADIAEEEDKLFKHVKEYRSKFWSSVWYLGDRNVLNDARRAKRLFFRYAVWIRTFDVYPVCFMLWRSPPKETFSMFSNDDKLSRKWDEISDWEQENCPFYVDYTDNPPVTFDQWEDLCYARRIEVARAQYAIEEASMQPELLPDLYEVHRQCLEKLPQVFDIRKVQNLSEEETVQQAKIFEPKVDAVLSVFAKLKRKKTVEESPIKTPAKSPDQSKETTAAETDPSSAPLARSARKTERKKKATDQQPEQQPEPTVTVAIPAGIPAGEPVSGSAGEDGGTEEAADIGTEQVDQTQDVRESKRKKKAEVKDFSNGEFRADLQFTMEKKWVPMQTSLLEVISALKQKRQQGRGRFPIPAIEELAGICRRLKTAGRRTPPFFINGQKTDQGADLIMIDIPTGRAIQAEKETPRWNVFPLTDDYPRLLLNLSAKILDDNGYIIIMHSDSLECCQQIADCLEASEDRWRHFLSYDVVNKVGTYVPHSKLMHYYWKVEVIVRKAAVALLPKQEYWPFDKNNSGRDSLSLFNYNMKMTGERAGEGKCVGFLQTLIENFSETDDVILDVTAHSGESLYAAANCGRVIVGFMDDIDGCEDVIARLMIREEKRQTEVAPTMNIPVETPARKKTLTADDDLGDIFGEE
ncbi:hypothetical protein R1sor_024992 [Riccia sorocarpa]|uniref:Uncharacterized protein n=1 Tax=Riccia sorocarpa TaxID=122646 RepID=A0ABD3G9A4_9MARC